MWILCAVLQDWCCLSCTSPWPKFFFSRNTGLKPKGFCVSFQILFVRLSKDIYPFHLHVVIFSVGRPVNCVWIVLSFCQCESYYPCPWKRFTLFRHVWFSLEAIYHIPIPLLLDFLAAATSIQTRHGHHTKVYLVISDVHTRVISDVQSWLHLCKNRWSW